MGDVETAELDLKRQPQDSVEDNGGERKRTRRRKSGWDEPATLSNDAASSSSKSVIDDVSCGGNSSVPTQVDTGYAQGVQASSSAVLQQQAAAAQLAVQRAGQQMQMATMMQRAALATNNPVALLAAQQTMAQAQAAMVQAQALLRSTVVAAASASPGVQMMQQAAAVQQMAIANVQAQQQALQSQAQAQAQAAQAALVAATASAAAAKQKALECRIYVGSLNYNITKEDVRALFEPFGPISGVDMSMDALTGRSKGFAFIEYNERAAAEAAIEAMNGFQIAGRAIKVGRPTGYAGPIPSVVAPASTPSSLSLLGGAVATSVVARRPEARVYVGGVVFDVNEAQLRSVFEAFGPIRSCELLPDPDGSGKHRGYGFIEYEEEKSATDAIQNMDGFDLAGRKLKVNRATSTGPGSGLQQAAPLGVSVGIVSPSSAVAAAIAAAQRSAPLVNPSRVVLLLNLVDTAEAEAEADSLQEEVAEEASAHGKVHLAWTDAAHASNIATRVVLRVVVTVVDGTARVFVLFSDMAGAAKAVGALNNRYFGGRVVTARYYDESNFDRNDYKS